MVKLPISVVIVGVGNGPFEKMVILDGKDINYYLKGIKD